MNTFATIVIAKQFKKVSYYSVKFENAVKSEFENFILRNSQNPTISVEYNDLLSFIKRIGNDLGAKAKYFNRKEKRAEALPPKNEGLTKSDRKLFVKQQHNLRLYCMRMTDEIVFLFNGDVKTPGPITAQQCNKVRIYFNGANQIAKAVDDALLNKEIKLEGMKIYFEDDYELEIEL